MGVDDDPLSTARRLSSTADVREHYRRWADTYVRDVFDRAGVVGSRRVAEVLASAQPDRTARVVDLGCGTGAVGRHLAELGFTDVTGIDLSPEMIAHALRAYRALVVADLRRPPVRAGAFDASVSAGTFTTGHLGGDDVEPLLALVRPGGVLAWTVAEPLADGIVESLARSGATIVDASVESIRPGTDDRAVLLVARTGNTAPGSGVPRRS